METQEILEYSKTFSSRVLTDGRDLIKNYEFRCAQDEGLYLRLRPIDKKSTDVIIYCDPFYVFSNSFDINDIKIDGGISVGFDIHKSESLLSKEINDELYSDNDFMYQEADVYFRIKNFKITFDLGIDIDNYLKAIKEFLFSEDYKILIATAIFTLTGKQLSI